MIKKILASFLIVFFSGSSVIAAEIIDDNNYLQAVIDTDSQVGIKKSIIFDASQSFVPINDPTVKYEWSFGDGNSNEGVEVLHSYKEPGYYDVTLSIKSGNSDSTITTKVFAYRKLIMLLTDKTEDQGRIEIIKDFAIKKGVYIMVVESFGSSTDFISEEILTKKLTENINNLQKAEEIIIWTKENAGLNALSRFIQSTPKKNNTSLSQKSILVLDNDLKSKITRIQRQYELLNPKSIVIAKEAGIDAILESNSYEEFINTLQERGNIFEVIDSKSGKLRPWNFMSYFVNLLINNGIPDNTIALLLLLPVIATVVAFMRQVVGVTTFGIYTPSIITLSFLIIGIHTGLLTLAVAIGVGFLSRHLLKRVRMLFIPKMAIVITLVSLALLGVLISSIYLGLFDAAFLSIAIFPMLILSTLVEKFVSSKGEKSFVSATIVMAETLLVAIIAYLIAGGEISLGVFSFKFEFIKRIMLSYPEIIILLLIINVLLGKWSGLRVLERIRFHEVLRHIEE